MWSERWGGEGRAGINPVACGEEDVHLADRCFSVVSGDAVPA